MRIYLLRVLAFSLIVAQSSCTTMVAIDLGEEREEISQYVAAGSFVRIVTNSGEEHEFEVTRLNSTTISGSEEEVPLDQVASLEVRISRDMWEDPVGNVLGIGSAVGILLLIGAYGG